MESKVFQLSEKNHGSGVHTMFQNFHEKLREMEDLIPDGRNVQVTEKSPKFPPLPQLP